jgi:integrase
MFKVPRPNGFPLFVHKSGKFGRWCKKVRQRFHYFGPVDPDASDYGAQAALERWLDEKDALLAGRVPRVSSTGVTIRELVNRFLTNKQRLLDSGEIVARTFSDCKSTCKRIVDFFGRERLVDDLAADDFGQLRVEMAKGWGPVRLGNEIQKTRSIFKYAYDEGLIDKPTRYGQSFNRPSQKTLRKSRSGNGPRMFDAREIRTMLTHAPLNLRAMILLGINCGFGNADCANLTISALDFDGAWVDFPRPKTGVARRCPLWEETVVAIQEAIAKRPNPRDNAHAELVFITRKHGSYFKESGSNPITRETTKLLTALGTHRPGLSFYALRHSFQTAGDGARDPVAVRVIMGHADAPNDMSAIYREGVDNERLIAVTDHVHKWLWPVDKSENRE